MPRLVRWPAVLSAAAAFAATSLFAGCGSDKPTAAKANLAVTGELPARTAISVTVDVPPDGSLVASPPGAVTLEGTAAVGAGAVAPGTLVFALDASQAAQAASAGLCDPGATGKATLLGCEIAAALKANGQANPATVTRVGVVIFGGGGESSATAQADMSGATGAQPFALPGADVAAVLGSITAGNVAMFTSYSVPTATPSFGAGLQAAGVLAGPGPGKTVVFLANGANAAGPAVASVAFPDGVVVRAFSLGDHGCGDDASGFGSLQQVADRGAPGSACQRLAALADMPDVTVAEVPRLESLSLVVDGGAPVDISASATPALPQDGPATVQYSHRVEGLLPGIHELCVRATGSDNGGQGTLDACVSVTVASIGLAPETHVSELGTPGQTHIVVATVAAGADGGVPGVPVSFEILSGPNAGATGSGTTDSAGQTSFTYAARQGLAGLGTDLISACFADVEETQACAQATQEWVDTTPPVPSCPPGPNPSGNVPGSAGQGGQNPSGFYRLVAVDAVDPDPQVFLRDAGSGTVFGPFHSGVAVKYTQAPGRRPEQMPMAGQVAWHIFGRGDAEVYGRDAVGNTSEPVWCLVPPKPK
ncbi:MAG TPA: hypothetical protein VFR85_05625 [Anaeromyxobacteraceae bacterium]|nr:hypothetical protein [Anaeromyxobacteraceae bacterium]